MLKQIFIRNLNKGWPVLLYVLLFGTLFVQFPLNGSLPGKGDAMFYLVNFKTIQNHLLEFFTGQVIGNALYPEAAVYPFGNYSFGQALFFLPFTWLRIGDVSSFYLLYVILFSLNAFAVYCLAGLWIQSRLARFFAGLVFSASNFMFGNLDNPDAMFLSLGILGVYFMWKALRNHSPGLILPAALMVGIEVYFSSYGFLFAVILIALILIYRWKWFLQTSNLVYGLTALVGFILIILPYCSIYIFDSEISKSYNPASSLDSVNAATLKWQDLGRSLKYNLIYAYNNNRDYNWLTKTKSASVGLALPVLGLVGFFRIKDRKWIISCFAIFFIIALGPWLGNSSLKSPLYFLYERFEIQNLFRISVRAYLICTLFLSISAFRLLEIELINRAGRVFRLIFFGISIFILTENVPYRFEYHNSAEILSTKDCLPEFSPDDVILNLPSSFYSTLIEGFRLSCDPGELDDYEFEFVREHAYMYHAVHHKANTINGVTGFVPWSRIENQKLIIEIMLDKNFEELVTRNEITHVIIHTDWFNGCDGEELISWISSNDLVELDSMQRGMMIFRTLI